MMGILLDINIVLDIFLARSPWLAESASVIRRASMAEPRPTSQRRRCRPYSTWCAAMRTWIRPEPS
jgi:hypothetical protein